MERTVCIDFQILSSYNSTLGICHRDGGSHRWRSVHRPTLGLQLGTVVVNGDGAGKWYWTKDKMNIGLAYPLFGVWGSNPTAAPDWYNSKNADASKVVTW